LLHRARAAQPSHPLLSGVLERYDERQARESALYTSWLAEAHLQAGDIDHAAHLAGRTLGLSSSTSSSRDGDRVALLRSRLDPYAAVPAVAVFLDRPPLWDQRVRRLHILLCT
jgi:hypothetical protein